MAGKKTRTPVGGGSRGTSARKDDGSAREGARATPKAKAKGTTTKAAAKPRAKQRQLKPSREDVFVQEYLVDLNGRQAAIRAGYSAQSARQTACELLAKPEVHAKLQKAMDERANRTGITADAVLERLWAMANADPRELTEHHRSCCRYCWGKDHKFQRTPRELEEARAKHELDQNEAIADAKAQGLRPPSSRPFDEAGGIGWDPRRDPHPDCPECFGEGIERVVFKDTRDLSPSARLLYAGVKTTQHGMEIKMHDPQAAMRDVGRHLGMFKDKVEHSGSVGVHKTVNDILNELDGAGTGLPPHGRGGS